VGELGVRRVRVRPATNSDSENCDYSQTAWLLRAVTCIDLTTLAGDDTMSNVQRLCYKVSSCLPRGGKV